MNRVKDKDFVFCAMRVVIDEVLEEAQKMGVIIDQIIFKVIFKIFLMSYLYCVIKSDRPSSQFWNSGMVLGLRQLSGEYGIPISHITEQSMHNKVQLFVFALIYLLLYSRTLLLESFLCSRRQLQDI